eukprot:CAMPEP_0184494348 /NCGR_PEP_ID=MMETSP0113_2-20130426/28498_1 /TAXON_ID=91329 /ORGANISM="Norrisiella sphaerica, Strain BC52" /LENGTH=160 /DNA_ID=CAMNT_0026880075 /DNA_START=1 /DNA_END=483 /DNA_ORIENTATION=-
MIVANFLVKDLQVDWRRGESYFMEKLIDGDFASNNGGWQWAAGCGTDAQPYFRIFNPESQSKKFDPLGVYCKKFIPELSKCEPNHIHNVPSDVAKRLGYPKRIVEHKEARAKALAMYSALKADQTGGDKTKKVGGAKRKKGADAGKKRGGRSLKQRRLKD